MVKHRKVTSMFVCFVSFMAILFLSLIIAGACWADNYIPPVVAWLIAVIASVLIILKALVVLGLGFAELDRVEREEKTSKWVDDELKRIRESEKKISED